MVDNNASTDSLLGMIWHCGNTSTVKSIDVGSKCAYVHCSNCGKIWGTTVTHRDITALRLCECYNEVGTEYRLKIIVDGR